MPVQIDQFMCGSDNFGVLVHDAESGETAVIDAPAAAPILAAIERTGWRPTRLLITHHHADHVEGNLVLKQRFGLTITGPRAEAAKIPGIDEQVAEGDAIAFGRQAIRVLETPGHTAGHVSYHFEESGVAFTGDTLFAIGCGRLFECPPEVMFRSLEKLAALPPATRVYCGHEYTETNARFALTVDPGNQALKKRAAAVGRLRAAGKPTLPTTIADELATNPFLRWKDRDIRRTVGLDDATDVAVFAEVRKRKDAFR